VIRFLFVRHTAHDWLPKGIAGRQAGVHLNSCGCKKAENLAEGLAVLRIEAIYCSPLERACETAEPLARRLQLRPQIAEEFNEVDMGEWSGRTFAELKAMPGWERWNAFRSLTTPPGGESMIDVQRRVLRKLSELRDRYSAVAIFSHGDVIRATVAYFLGVHLDLFQRIKIDPGSVSAVELGDDFVGVCCVNTMVEGVHEISALVSEDTTAS
jgi:broad specificity phosphatase PhoE